MFSLARPLSAPARECRAVRNGARAAVGESSRAGGARARLAGERCVGHAGSGQFADRRAIGRLIPRLKDDATDIELPSAGSIIPYDENAASTMARSMMSWSRRPESACGKTVAHTEARKTAQVGSTRDKVKRAVRETVKWGGAVLTVLLLVVWIGSGWWGVTWYAPWHYALVCEASRLMVIEPPGPAPWFGIGEFEFKRSTALSGWWFDGGAISGQRFVIIPLWPLPLLSLLATAAAWRADAKYLRRAREGACLACGYDRAALAAGAVCPECGAGDAATSA